MNMNDNLRDVFVESAFIAKTLNQEILVLEHFFLAIIRHQYGIELMQSYDIDVKKLWQGMDEYLRKNIPQARQGKIISDADLMQTPPLLRVIDRLEKFSQNSNKRYMGIGDFLISAMYEYESYTYIVLSSFGVTKENLTKRVVEMNEDAFSSLSESDASFNLLNEDLKTARFIEKKRKASFKNSLDSINNDERKDRSGKNMSMPNIGQYAKDLNKLAKAGEIDPLVGRDKEISEIAQILCRRKKNNPILIGEAGVGKSAIVEGLALRIVQKKVPEKLHNVRIFSVDLNAIIAGTKYRGEFESRLQNIFNEIEKNKNAVIFLDEVQMIVGAGQSQGGNMDMSNILKPRLTSGELRCIGATTFNDYKNSIDKDKALARRFRKVDILEPTEEECLEILTKIAPQYEKFHNVKYDNEALRSCVFLSSKYISDKHLPDKAIDLMDEIGARLQLTKGVKDYKVTKYDIEDLLSQIVNIPKSSMSSDEKSLLKNLQSNLKSKIFSQDEAIEKVVQQIMINKSGLGEINRPIASFLFSGPSGVGKTELSKELAHTLGIKFERIDMSEYSEAHSVSKLIGSPAGYVGYDDGGLLITKIRSNPHCVLLLDEIEKAHSDIYNILLQVMDSAVLSDNKGNKADFKNVILIMTSNAGSKEGNSMGFINTNENRKDRAIKDIFSPEFRSRLDCVVYFNSLGESELENIAIKYLGTINDKLKDKNIKITMTKSIAQNIAKRSMDSALGAREIKKIIDGEIKLPLSKMILFEGLKNGGNIKIVLKNHKLELQLSNKKIKEVH